jgi:hypothetical protein
MKVLEQPTRYHFFFLGFGGEKKKKKMTMTMMKSMEAPSSPKKA